MGEHDLTWERLNDLMAENGRLDQIVDELLDERTFLLARHPGDFTDWTWVGLSSDCMVAMAIKGLTLEDHDPKWWPSDASDLSRCEATYLRAPGHLKPRMLPVLEAFRAHVAERYPEAEAA